MTVLYICPACEAYGDPWMSEDCNREYCGKPYEDVKDEVSR